MNRFYLLSLTIALLILSCSSTNETISEKDKIDVTAKDNNSLLWKIEKEGHQTSYIFGTMHMIEPEFYNFTPHMTHILQSSDAVIMEIGGEPNPLQAMGLLILKEGQVEDFFTENQLSNLLTFMKTELGMTPEQFHKTYSKMKPFFILQTISQSYFSKNAKSYDLNIMQMAKSHKKELIGFESMEEQLSFFDAIPKTDIANLIMASVENFEKEKKSTLKLQKIYAKQKVDKLIPLMKTQSPEFMAFEDIFLTNRNKAWIPKIISETKSKKCFIAVGAAHLFDTNGVLELLKKEDFRVTPILK